MTIGDLTNLTSLDLMYNQLTNLPNSIGHLTRLTQLDLIYNQLTSLPETIGNLTNLTELHLSENPISQKEKIRLQEIFGDKVKFK